MRVCFENGRISFHSFISPFGLWCMYKNNERLISVTHSFSQSDSQSVSKSVIQRQF